MDGSETLLGEWFSVDAGMTRRRSDASVYGGAVDASAALSTLLMMSVPAWLPTALPQAVSGHRHSVIVGRQDRDRRLSLAVAQMDLILPRITWVMPSTPGFSTASTRTGSRVRRPLQGLVSPRGGNPPSPWPARSRICSTWLEV